MAIPWHLLFGRAAREGAEATARAAAKGSIPKGRVGWSEAFRSQFRPGSWRETAEAFTSGAEPFREGLREIPRNPMLAAFTGLSAVQVAGAATPDRAFDRGERRQLEGRMPPEMMAELDRMAQTVEERERGSRSSRIGGILGAEAAAIPLAVRGRFLPATVGIIGAGLVGAGLGKAVDRMRGKKRPSDAAYHESRRVLGYVRPAVRQALAQEASS